MEQLPMFPLGTVLLPHMALPLHVFEPRYRTLMHQLLRDGPDQRAEFGVVLITRGREIGGGEERTNVGTVARIVRAEQLDDGRWLAIAVGTRRIRVERWLPDDPYPRAVVTALPERHDDAEVIRGSQTLAPKVRRILALRRELGDETTTPDYEVSTDIDVACWQPAVASPLTPLDAQRVLATDDCGRRLDLLDELLDGVQETLTFRLRNGDR